MRKSNLVIEWSEILYLPPPSPSVSYEFSSFIENTEFEQELIIPENSLPPNAHLTLQANIYDVDQLELDAEAYATVQIKFITKSSPVLYLLLIINIDPL